MVRDALLASRRRESTDSLRRRAVALFPLQADRDQYVYNIQQGDLFAAFQLPPFLINYLEAQLGTTWFTMEAPASAVYISGSGTAPGSPVADLFFHFLYSRFLVHMETALLAEGHCVRLHSSDAKDSVAPTWADDTALLIGPLPPDRLAPTLSRVASLLSCGLSGMGLEANFGPGKSEAVVHIAGPGSAPVRRDLLCNTDPGVPFLAADGGPGFLRIVPQYTHLGTVISHNSAEGPIISSIAPHCYGSCLSRCAAGCFTTGGSLGRRRCALSRKGHCRASSTAQATGPLAMHPHTGSPSALSQASPRRDIATMKLPQCLGYPQRRSCCIRPVPWPSSMPVKPAPRQCTPRCAKTRYLAPHCVGVIPSCDGGTCPDQPVHHRSAQS